VSLFFSLIIAIFFYFPQQQHQQQAVAQTVVTAMTTMTTTTTAPHSTTITTLSPTHSFYLTYTSPTLGMKIEYPSSWKKIEGDVGVIFQSPEENDSDEIRGGLDILVFPRSNNNISAQELAIQAVNSYRKSLVNFHLIESRPTILSGSLAHMLVYNYTDPYLLIPLKAMDIGTVSDDDRIYVMSYYAESAKYSKYLPTIQKMIESFEIISSTTTTTKDDNKLE
jgi:serine/threonine-protein kinase